MSLESVLPTWTFPGTQLAKPGVAAIGARAITRRFPGVVANDKVTFDVMPGEVHALLGENGSGKTTLCKILTGLYRPDEGGVVIDGEPVHFSSPRDAYQAGVFMVQQHFSLVERLTVAENVVLGWSRQREFFCRRKEIEAEVAATSAEFHMAVDPTAYIWQLSVGERQRVEILKALYRGARILILDEPTTVLTPVECEHLFTSLRQMASAGASVIFISHKLREVLAVCDRVTVLRKGRTVGSVDVREDSAEPRMLARMMVGRDITLTKKPPSPISSKAEVALRVNNISVTNNFGHVSVRELSLEISQGEILGLAGVAGNGQRELAEAITGLRSRTGGTIVVGARTLRNGQPRSAIEAGVAYVPEDRMGTGLVPTLKVTDNVALKAFRSPDLSWGPIIRSKSVLNRTRELLDRFDVRGTPENFVRQLSGGNAQKVLLAREMSCGPKVLVVAALTRGLDVSAMESVRALLLKAASEGVGVLLISEDLDEVLDLADRVAVIYAGQIMGVVDPNDADREHIGLMMAGMGAGA